MALGAQTEDSLDDRCLLDIDLPLDVAIEPVVGVADQTEDCERNQLVEDSGFRP